ncbi:MAG: hypothetical protein ACE5LC_10745 [Candidatus Aminicenantales bacterium]
MEELDVLKRLGRVKAPPDFERNLLALLPRRKEERRLRARYTRFSLAGALAAVLITFVVMSVVFVNRGTSPGVVELKQTSASPYERGSTLSPRVAIPVIETIDYSKEVRRIANERGVIYILESVSTDYKNEIKY